jgi:hypothetical protein
MIDRWTDLEIKQKVSVHPQGENVDGTYLVTRGDVISSLARAILGPNYGGNLRLKVIIGDNQWLTEMRGATVYTVKDGEVVERVDLPLLAIGWLDPRITKIQKTS